MRCDWAVSIRQACRALRFDTSTYHYKSRRAGQAGLEQRIREICETRVRYGYRRVQGQVSRAERTGTTAVVVAIVALLDPEAPDPNNSSARRARAAQVLKEAARQELMAAE